MAKKIVVLNGSPRANGNTKELVRLLLKVRKVRETPYRFLICRK